MIIVVISVCNLGPTRRRSLRDVAFEVALDALKTTRTRVVELDSRTTGWWGKYTRCDVASPIPLPVGIGASGMWPNASYSDKNA